MEKEAGVQAGSRASLLIATVESETISIVVDVESSDVGTRLLLVDDLDG